jgi:hypothetical protein
MGTPYGWYKKRTEILKIGRTMITKTRRERGDPLLPSGYFFPALPGFPFPLGDGLFNGIPYKTVKPFIVKGLLGPDYGPNGRFKLIPACFTNIPVGYVKETPLVNLGSKIAMAHITFYTFHSNSSIFEEKSK